MGISHHEPVMVLEVLSALNPKVNDTFVDLTLGRGGHSTAILKKLGNGLLIGFDKDIDAIEDSKQVLSKVNPNFKLIQRDFKDLKAVLHGLNTFKVNGFLADLGVSSPQIDSAARGFSFRKDATLDMRMDQTQELSALNIINEWKIEEIVNILRKNADVRFAWRIAKAVLERRPINTTLELVNAIKSAIPTKYYYQKNVSRQVFQAIRIEVNNELDSLQKMLREAPDFLKVGASLCILTFHSIEDRIVKNAFKPYIENKTGKLPIIEIKRWKAKTFYPTESEINLNRRSRSAKLRVLTRISE